MSDKPPKPPATMPNIGRSYPVPPGSKPVRASKAERRMLRAQMKNFPMSKRVAMRELARRR